MRASKRGTHATKSLEVLLSLDFVCPCGLRVTIFFVCYAVYMPGVLCLISILYFVYFV